jgi:carboxyl-terminal processing protease
MPKRNVVWLVVGAVVAVLLWRVPEALIRRDALYREFSPLLDVHTQVQKNYVEPIEGDVLLRGAIDGMLNRLDPYSAYFSAAEYEQFNKRTEGQFYGIGIVVDELESGELVVVSPIEGSPAFRAGLRAHDRIQAIGDEKTTDLSLEEGVDLITGAPGTTVTLTLYRPSTDTEFTRTIERGLITVPTVRGWARSADYKWDYVIDPEYRIGYIRILSFERTTAEQLDAIARRLLNEDDMRGLIIDVRDDPGGLLDVVVHIADRFIEEGTIVSTRGLNTPEQVYSASRENTYPDIPLVVLVNHGSASASEILAGALQDYGRAIVVGEQTFGKGSVQEMFKVDSTGGVVKLTTAYYYLPRGERIHGRGIIPDRVVELTPEQRAELHESQMAVYAGGDVTTTGPAGAAPGDGPVHLMIDPQLQAALDVLRTRLVSAPVGAN